MSMTYRPFFYVLNALFLLLLGTSDSCAKLIEGNIEQDSGITFTFPVGKTLSGDRFFIAAHESGAGAYALSALDPNKQKSEPLTSEFATVNGEKDTENPLFDQAIEHMALLGSTMGTLGSVMQRPIVTIPHNPGLYLIFDSNRSRSKVIHLETLKDAVGNTTAGVVGLSSGGLNFICAAVKGHEEEQFGGNHSGIAIAALTEDIPPGDYRKREMLVQTDARNKEFVTSCASPFNNASPMVRFKTGSNATILDDAIDMHWDPILERLFVAVRVKASDDEDSGVRALAIGLPRKGRLFFALIAPDELFDGAHDKLVGAKGANACASIRQVKTLHFNGRSHVIILGGSGALAASKRTVFALPIVNGGNTHEIGTLAHINASITETTHEKTGKPIRAITQPALTPDHAYTASSVQAHVGGGPLDVGDIETIFVHNSAIYAFVPSADEGKQSGLFVSRALLNPNGMISGWSTWQRCALCPQGTTAVNIDPAHTAYTFITEHGGQTIITQTEWGSGNRDGFAGLVNEVNEVSGTEQAAALEYLTCVNAHHASLHNTNLLICTGTNRVVLAETARTNNCGEVITCPYFSEHKHSYPQGTIEENPTENTTLIEFTGGELEKLGPIVSAEIASDCYLQNGWLFAGGVHGLAVLAYPNGSGWNPRNNELGPGFNGLRSGMTFMPIGNYRFIRKLFHDRGFLYVLTDQYLDRIDLLHANFARGDVSDATLRIAHTKSAEPFEQCSVLYDCLVSEKLCLLATNCGLFRIGNGQDITGIQTADEIDWQVIPTSTLLPPIQLTAISATGIPQSVARDKRGGTVYVLCTDRGCNRSCLYSLAITDTSGNNTITHETVRSQLALRFKNARNYVATDGACIISARNQNLPHACALFGRNDRKQDITLELDAHATQISSLVQCKATGTWFIGGDFGLRVNE